MAAPTREGAAHSSVLSLQSPLSRAHAKRAAVIRSLWLACNFLSRADLLRLAGTYHLAGTYPVAGLVWLKLPEAVPDIWSGWRRWRGCHGWCGCRYGTYQRKANSYGPGSRSFR